MNSRVDVPPRFSTVTDVRRGLRALEATLLAREDPRAAFAIAYAETTEIVETWIEQRRFLQTEMVSSYVVAFANAYRDAFARFEVGHFDAVPAAWRQSFEARDRTTSMLQHLLLGINAHINHDLPHAVLGGGLDVRCPRCYRDHLCVDEALRAAIPPIRGRLAARLGWPMRGLNVVAGPAIDRVVSAAFVRARRHAWTLAAALDAAPNEVARSRIAAFIERRAAQAGRRILAADRAPLHWLASVSGVQEKTTSNVWQTIGMSSVGVYFVPASSRW